MKLIQVVGARPNFMKAAPLMEAYRQAGGIEALLVHTGQHYDEKMSGMFFRQLGMPRPDVNLGVAAVGDTAQTVEIMQAFEPVLLEHAPDAVVVVGDVTSTVACGLVAVKRGVPLVHIEAGLRSFDRTMPEEINRLVTDAISDLLFCTEQSGVDNLLREGRPAERIFLVGNLMIDTLLKNRERAAESAILDELKLPAGEYFVLTLHRPSNVDAAPALTRMLEVVEALQAERPIVFPVHPRTRNNLRRWSLHERLEALPNVRLLDPVGYLDFLKLLSHARLVLTDSGGIQEETTILQVPCVTLRENTERPATVEAGWNHLAGTAPAKILEVCAQALAQDRAAATAPPLWDGQAAARIVHVLRENIH